MFSQLKALLQAGDSAAALNVLANLETNYNKLSSEVEILEIKGVKAIVKPVQVLNKV